MPSRSSLKLAAGSRPRVAAPKRGVTVKDDDEMAREFCGRFEVLWTKSKVP